jgi:hypothetical protein
MEEILSLIRQNPLVFLLVVLFGCGFLFERPVGRLLGHVTSRLAQSNYPFWFLIVFFGSIIPTMWLTNEIMRITGMPLFSTRQWIVLIGLIAIHEFGHWSVLRSLGYRPFIVWLLPLGAATTEANATDLSVVQEFTMVIAGCLYNNITAIILAFLMVEKIVVGDMKFLNTVILLHVSMTIMNLFPIFPFIPTDGVRIRVLLFPEKVKYWQKRPNIFVIGFLALVYMFVWVGWIFLLGVITDWSFVTPR